MWLKELISVVARTAWPVVLALCAHVAQAETVWVGNATDNNCDTSSVQDAINRVQAVQTTVPAVIKLARSATYTQQALSLNTARDLTFEGGYQNCQDAAPDSNGLQTTLDGAGGVQASVISMTIRTGGLVRMQRLIIRGGDAPGDKKGGGIYLEGDGELHIHDSLVMYNLAGYGGGIYVYGTGNNAGLVLGRNVIVHDNTARKSGGGIYLDSAELTMVEPGSSLNLNVAGSAAGEGWGGGLKVLGDRYAGIARIASSRPLAGIGAIAFNQADYGGGVAIESRNNKNANAFFYTNDPAQPLTLHDNLARKKGGALYLERVGYSEFWDANLLRNQAPDGAAVYLGTDGYTGARVRFNEGERPAAAVRCNPRSLCNRIENNRSAKADGTPTEGSTLHGDQNAWFFLRDMVLAGNRGGHVVRTYSSDDGQASPSTLTGILATGNATTGELIWSGGGLVRLFVSRMTLADNTINAFQVMRVAGYLDLKQSIIWQPGKTTLQHSSGTRMIADVLASEIASIVDGGERVTYGQPRFVAPEAGDFRLQATSPAVDYAPAVGGTDLNGNPRGLDLDLIPNRAGPTDLGAYERQQVMPLLNNGHFATDLRSWKAGAAATTWSSESAPTSSGGSALLEQVGGPVYALGHSQCFFLPPGPVLYRLDGWGRSGNGLGVQRDAVLLRWELRYQGGVGCDGGGAPDSVGELFITTSTSWSRAAQPEYIAVDPARWSPNTSIKVTQVVYDNGLQAPGTAKGWFDGITLEIADGTVVDRIFASGFEAP